MNFQHFWKYASLIVITLAFIVPIATWLILYIEHFRQADISTLLLIRLIGRTHLLALLVASCAVLVSAPAALYCRIATARNVLLISSILIAPLSIGMIARNYAWIGMLSNNNPAMSMGWKYLSGEKLLYTQTAVYIVMTFIFAPWSFFMLKLALDGVTTAQIEAAITLGASRTQLIWRIFFPALLRGASVAFLLIYCSVLGYFITPKMIGGNSGDLAGSVIIRFTELANFSLASKVAFDLLITTIPFALAFLWLIQRRYRIAS